MLLMKEKALNGWDEKKRMTHRLTDNGIGGQVERCLVRCLGGVGVEACIKFARKRQIDGPLRAP